MPPSVTMPTHEMDISWQVLRQIVRDWAGNGADLEQVQPLTGGYINTALSLQTKSGEKAVLKITPHRVDRSHADEGFQLQLLRQIGLPVPEVYQVKIGTLDHPFSYILMEFVEGVDFAQAKSQCSSDAYDALQNELAEAVVKMHGQTSAKYSRIKSTGATAFDSWPQFYREIYDPIWHDVEKSAGIPVKCRKQVAKLHERLGQFLAHDDCPRLLHWDIWATNLLARSDGNGSWHLAALLDPNCKFGHAEAEIAYMELFHTASPIFLRVYQQSHRLPSEYHRLRKPIYQLYCLLNHLHLFGQEYVSPAVAAIERVSHLI